MNIVTWLFSDALTLYDLIICSVASSLPCFLASALLWLCGPDYIVWFLFAWYLVMPVFLGATRDIGSALTRMCMRHRSIEAKLRHFTK